MEDMSDIAGGTDNPAFAIGDECSSEQQVTLHEDTGSPGDDDVNPPTENGGHRHQQHNYVSQHYVEGTRAADGVQEGHYKNEMRIELPVSQPNVEKSSEPKLNGVHGNGNNNDASFLNNSVASVQVNDGVGKKEQIEAVNLELVSMRPYTGNNLQTKGQEACEVPADPYEEYFVPVNEHRKYIRGEKLYVTKDKRSRSSYWRRMACWGCGLLVLAVAIVIAILAATGTILTQEATEALTNVDHQSRHFGGAQAAGSQEYVKNPPSSPPPETSSFPPWPTTDETLYHTVPNALDGIIKLDNLTWQPAMSNETTREFQQVATELETQLKRMLRSTSDSPVVKVYRINEEGEVMFRISNTQLPTPEETQQMAEKALRENDQTIGPYHISRLQVGRLLDLCQHRDFGCAEECRFDYSRATFACSCTSGKTLTSNGKDCIDENDLSNVDMEEPGKEVAHDGHEHEEATSRGSDHSVSDVQKSTSTVTTTTPAATTVPEIPQHVEVEHSRAHDFNDDVWSHEYSKHSQAKASTEEAESATKFSAPGEPNHVEFMVPTTTEALSITEVEAAESYTKMFKEANNSETTLEPEHLTTLFNESETERKEGDGGLKVIPLSVPPSADTNNSVNVEKVNTEANIVTVPMETTTVAMDNERRQEETTTLETNSETVTENGNVNSPAEGEHIMLISENEHSNGEENVEEHSTVSGGGNTNTMTTERNLDRSTAQPDENVVFTEDATEYPTSHPLYPAVFQENNVNHDDGNDETHVEDMSPFLPDVHKEKETSKKAPRLDKDEQDVPNPFETHIEDVVINQPETNSTAEITELPDASPIPDGQLNNVTEIGEDKKESLDASEDVGKIESDLQNQVQQNGLLREDSDIQKNSSDIETFNSTPNNEREETTTVAVEELETTVQSAENDTTTSSSVKPDENAVEDNYNDIVDETLPKTFKHEDSEVITEPTLQNGVNDSERGTESSGTSVVTTPSTNSSEDAKLTTQVPVLPIEIQQELSTTTESIDKSTEKIDAATASEESTTSESSTEGPNVVRTDTQAETNATVQTSTMNPMYSVETKTTTQVPILPEELQTTEHESLATTSMKPEETTNEATTSSGDFTTTVVSNESTTLDDVEYNETTTTIDSSMTLITDNFTTYTTIANDLLSEINTNNISTEITVTEMTVTEKDETSETSEDKESTTVSVDYTTSYPQVETTLTTTTEDIRPVTEIINDTNVDYQYRTPFLTTTPKQLLLPDKTSDELSSPILSEEDLRVIPLEKFGAVSDSRSTERKEAAKYKYKVEKVRYLGDPSKEEEGVEIYGSEDEEKNQREERKDEQKERNETEVKEESKDENKEKSETEGKEENKDENKVKNETEGKEENKNENQEKNETEVKEENKDENKMKNETEVKQENKDENQEKNETEVKQENKDENKMKNETEGKEENEDENKENIATENTLNSTTLFTTEIPKESFTEIPENVTENTTNFDPSMNSNLSSSISPHTEDNTVRIPQLKFIHHVIDLVSGNQSEEATNELEFKENTTITELSNNSTADLKKYPSFIPVSEEIIEPQPVTEPFILLRNYNAYPAVTLTTLIAETTTTTTAAASTTMEKELGGVPNAGDDHFENTIINANETTPEQTSELMEETSTSTTTSTTHSISTDEYAQSITNFPYNRIFSKCTAGQFQCTNGTSRDGAYCVSLSSKCDSENDCSDGSDELNCEAEGCPGNFQCANAQCLKRHLVCNGIVDCDDGSDEINCQNWTCNFDEFQCTSGRCIPMLWKCNGRPDCKDHRDEYSCAESCANNEYLCPTEKWCIPQTWRCNGERECVDGDDEKLCDCALDQFKCQYGGCVRQVEVCDGIEHCPDHSDEWNCLSSFSTVQRNETDAEIQKEGSSDLANELTGRPSLLKIRQFNEEHRLVCSDGWNEELSDSYCRSLGYASSETTTGRRWDGTSKILRLKSNPNDRAPLVTNLETVDFCVSNEVVEVSCQEFSCGFHHAEGPTARLVGGTRAGEGQWTSVALLKENKYGSACTASILGPLHALASYSCVSRHKESSGWQLYTGGNLLKANLVKSIIPYPQVKYNQFLYDNDIALVELEEPLIFSRNVSAACLPTHPIQPRQICVTAGWRFPVNGEVDLQQYLEFLPVPTHESEKCNATSHYAGFITKYNICAGLTDTDKGPCYNDEGAPLMCVSESGRWEIQGLLSHHSRCSRGHPAIYSSLEPALLWLRNSVPALQA